MRVDKKERYTTIRIKQSTKKNLEILRGVLALKYSDRIPFDLANTVELIEREYFKMTISKHPEIKKLLKKG
jgi:hypothetical protein